MTNWQTKKLGDAMEFIPTGSHSRNDMMSGLSADKNAVFNIHYGDIHTKYTTYVDFDKDIVPILKENSVRSSMELQDGDLVVADASEDYAGVGSAVELRNVSERKVIGGLHTFALRSKNDEFASGFTGLILKNPATHKRLMQMSVYSKVYGLTKSSIASVDVSYPEKPEQERIVGVLEVWDEYIEKLEQKIALKEQLKKGLMQQLLTGKHRLPGFSGEWQECRAGDFLIERKEYASKGKSYEHVSLTKDGVVPKSARYERDFLVRTENKQYRITRLGDICYNPANLKFGTIARNHYKDAIFSPIYITYDVKNCNIDFVEYLVTSHHFIGHALRYEEGTVYERMAVHPDDLATMKVKLPSFAEQKSIANVINAVKDETDVLYKRLSIIKLQKKYLLKNLITGAIRTPEDLKPLDTTRLERSAL